MGSTCGGKELVRIYCAADSEVVAFQVLDLEVAAGKISAVVSSSGKTTLLNVLGGFDRSSADRVDISGTDLLSLNDAALAAYCKDTVGFVW